jgi:propionyl-CoA carboxylase alpha chain
MFDKVLIANRGEIALRVLRACKELGIATVAVHSTADANAMHVRLADESVCIGPPASRDSYLNIPALLAACEITGADAIHPGYGFLSENARFAEILESHGITFIGPKSEHIRIMGDKIEAKRTARKLGIPCVPGSDGGVTEDDEALRIAQEIGYPVIVKAAAGGGGRGMKVARTKDDLIDALQTARTEAKAAFGDDAVYIEKFLEKPRHIEIQVLGDKHGNVIYLGERECSIQRRNQKVIEEAPSPLLDEATRQKMGEQAVALAKAVNYDSAGTVEFVAGQDKSFFFLEMNTRLQVEHPVTELITGVDLVEEMIRSAFGEKLRLKQSDIKLNGWAVESRVYAEDPTRNFMPSTGRLTVYRPPAEGSENGVTVRNDTGVYEGGEISIYYDPMIAKLVTHAPTRAQAIAVQAHALDAFAIDGIRHNIPFLSALMAHPRWQAGELSTGFIAEEFPEGFHLIEPEGNTLEAMAAIGTSIDHRMNERKRHISGQLRAATPVRFARERVVALGERRLPLIIENEGETLALRFIESGRTITLRSEWRPGQPVWHGTIDGKPVAAQIRPTMNGVRISYSGTSSIVRVFTQRESELESLMPPRVEADTSKSLICPMPGLVKALSVTVGQEIKAGEMLCIVEAMKMENVLRAERDGTISKIHAKEGDSLAVDAVIMEFA